MGLRFASFWAHPPLFPPLVTVRSIIPFNGIFTLIMVLAVAVALMVILLVAFIVVRYRGRPGDALPRQVYGSRKIEILWTAIPSLIIAGIFVYMLAGMFKGPTPGNVGAEGQDPDIIVIGHQWWWEVRYPKFGGVVNANEVHIPVGRPVLINLTSADVQHDFWVPQLSQKMDVYPGHVNFIQVNAPKAGNYQGTCAEFCGAQHAWMRILVIAQPQAEFDAWIQAQKGTTAPPATDQIAQGRQLFTQNACGNCHTIAGTSDQGKAAPELTNFSARQTISAGVLPNTPENLKRYLKDPQAVKPGIYMPNFHLRDVDIDALVAYLESLK